MTSEQLFNEEPGAFLLACLMGLVVWGFLARGGGVFCLFLTAIFSVTSLDHFEGSYPFTL